MASTWEPWGWVDPKLSSSRFPAEGALGGWGISPRVHTQGCGDGRQEMPSAQGGSHRVISTHTEMEGGQTSSAPGWLVGFPGPHQQGSARKGLLQSREGEIITPRTLRQSIHSLPHPRDARLQGMKGKALQHDVFLSSNLLLWRDCGQGLD